MTQTVSIHVNAVDGWVCTSITFFPGCSAAISFSPSSFSLVMVASLDSRHLLMKFCWSETDVLSKLRIMFCFFCPCHLHAACFHAWCVSVPQLPRTASGGQGSLGWCRSSRSWSSPQPVGPSSTAHWCSAACSRAGSAGYADERWKQPSQEKEKLEWKDLDLLEAGPLSWQIHLRNVYFHTNLPT